MLASSFNNVNLKPKIGGENFKKKSTQATAFSPALWGTKGSLKFRGGGEENNIY